MSRLDPAAGFVDVLYSQGTLINRSMKLFLLPVRERQMI